MVSADVAFRDCSNRAAVAIVQRAPAYLTYRSSVHVSAPSLRRERDVNRLVSVRTSDDYAIVADLPHGREQVGIHSFPVPPTFDALSDFQITGYGGPHASFEAHVVYQHPLSFPPPVPSAEHVDVIVVRLQGYRAHYVGSPESNPIHVELEPLPGLIKHRTDLAFKDVFIDPATFLPTRVTFEGADDRTLAVDYARVDGQWVVNHVSYGETYYGPLHVGRVHFNIEAKFDLIRYYDAEHAPDARLIAKP